MNGRETDAARRPLIAASLACFRDGKVLIARRGQGPNRGLWSFPGGGVEFGETAADAARREFLEETGAEAAVIGFVELVESIDHDAAGRPERHAVILAYAGRLETGEPTPTDEAEALAWVRPEDLGAYETTPGLDRVARRAAELAA